MRVHPRRLACAAFAAPVLAASASALAAKPPPCPGGAFEVAEAAGPLVPGGAVPDLLQIGDDGTVSIASGCPEVAGKLKVRKKGTRLRAKWSKKRGLRSGLPKKAKLRVRFDPSCDALSGKFRSKHVKVVFTARRAGIALDGKVPASIHGEPLSVGHAGGDELVAADPGWADTFVALGTAAPAVELSTAEAEPGSALDLHVGAWTAPGADWARRVADFAAGVAAHPESGYAAEAQSLGGRDVLAVTVPSDPGFAPCYYGTDGDTLFLVTTGDAGLAGEVLAELPFGAAAPLAAGTPRGSPPVPGASPPLVLQAQPMKFPVCVAEPYGRLSVWLMAFDSYYQVPVPAQFLLIGHLLGETLTPFEVGALVRFPYRATLFGSQEELLFQVIAPAGGQGVAPPIQFPVQHCLGGTWQDADRILRIYQDLSQVTAEVESGTLCDEPGGVAFTGVLLPADDHFSGSDLKACNPDECVSAGLLDPTTVVEYQATIALDGSSVQIDWGSVQFDYVYDDSGDFTACTPNGDVQPRSFSITRNTFGPGVP